MILLKKIKQNLTVKLLFLSFFCISCHHSTISDECGCTKMSFWKSSYFIVDSLIIENSKTLFFFVDSGRMIRNEMKPYNKVIIKENLKRIDPYGFLMWPVLDSSVFRFVLIDTLRQFGNFQQDIVLEYRNLEGLDFYPYQAYRIIVTRNNKFISSTLLAKDGSIIGGHRSICSSFIFSDSIILRKSCHYLEDKTDEKIELLTFNKISGSYDVRQIIKSNIK